MAWGFWGGMELIKDRTTIEPVDESQVMKIVRRCMRQGLMIGRTNRSLTNLNNTLCLTPALIATKTDIDQIVEMLDIALTEAPHLAFNTKFRISNTGRLHDENEHGRSLCESLANAWH